MYDVLTIIFTLTDSKFRQKHFRELLNYYYQTFSKSATRLKTVSDRNELDYQLKTLLPLVKFETLIYLLKFENTTEQKELVNDLNYYVKYPQLNREDCIQIISKEIGTCEFELMDYEIVRLGQTHGYLGAYYSFRPTVRHNGEIEKFKLFVKVLVASNEQLTAIAQSGAAKLEDIFYNTLVPEFAENGLGPLLDFAPKQYFSRHNDVLVLEDLIELGYKAIPNDATLSYEQLKACYIECAKFHAVSFILEDIHSKREGKIVRISDLYGEFEDWIFLDREGIPTTPLCTKNSGPGTLALIDSFPQFSDVLTKDDLKKKVSEVLANISSKLSAHKTFRNVLCHGDLYASNLLLKENPSDNSWRCKLVDFQAMRYGPLFQDILLLLYSNAEKETRDKYFYILLDDYYNALTAFLKEFDLDIKEHYPRKEFMEEAEYMKGILLIVGSLYVQLLITPEKLRKEVLQDNEKYHYYIKVNRAEYMERLLALSEEFSKYTEGMVRDMYDFFKD